MVGSLPFIVAFSLLGMQDPAPHKERALDVRVRAVFPFITGDISATANSQVGATLDVEDVLDLDSPGDSGDLMISALVFPWFRIHAEYWVARFQGTDTVDQFYYFGGSAYNQGQNTRTDLDLQIGTLMGEYNVLFYQTPLWRVELGLELGLGLIGLDIHHKNVDAIQPFTERQRFNTPIPVLGLYGRMEIFETLSMELRVKGITVSGFQDADITLLKASAEIQTFLFKGVYISGGWQFLVNKGTVAPHNDEEIDYDFTFHGPFFSFGYTF